MANPVTLDTLKLHLNLDSTYTADDALLQIYLDGAYSQVDDELREAKIDELVLDADGDVVVDAHPDNIKNAILLMAGTFYDNRADEGSIKTNQLSMGVKRLVSKYRRDSIV